MPRLADIFDSLDGATYFSKLDINNGYYNFSIHPDDRHKTAFVTQDGLYEFLRVPQGLKTSPALFNRLLRKIFANLLYSKCFLYLDDILVYGSSFNSHLEALKSVFVKLQINNLKLKPSKCFFGFQEVKILGHVISSKGVAVDPTKIESITKLPIPTSSSEIKSILGLCGYYRRFIPNYADLTRPLIDLTKQNVPYVWTKACQIAFEIIKERLTNAPLLSQFNESLPVIIHTDASNYGIGAVCSQLKNNREHVISYASRVLNSAEVKYNTSEKECLALIWALSKFREYVFGRPVTVYTDHMALLSLQKTTNSKNLRLARWSLALQESDITIKHRRGVLNGNADAISRVIPFPERSSLSEKSQIPSTVNSLVGIDYRSHLISEQRSDPILSEIINKIKLKSICKETKHFSLLDNILYYNNPINHKLLICIPTSMINEILYAHHDHFMSSHPGIDRTYLKIKNKFYVNNLKKHVTNYVRNCITCAKRNSSNTKKIGLMHPGQIYNIFDKIYVDLIGPLVETKHKNKFIIVCIDYFSKYVITKACKYANSASLAKFLIENVFLMYGVSREIVLDNAKMNRSKIISEITARIGTKPIYISAYHHQAAGAVERVNRTIQEALSKYIDKNQENWDIHLPSVTFGLNTAPHTSTQYSPYEILYGRPPNLPLDILLDTPTVPYLQVSQRIRMEVKQNLLLAQKRYSKNYNKARLEKSYPVNSKVMISDLSPKPGTSKKLNFKFQGPYVIVKQISPLHYKIKPVNSPSYKKSQIVHANRIKPFGNNINIGNDSPSPNSPVNSDSEDSTDSNQYKPPKISQQQKSVKIKIKPTPKNKATSASPSSTLIKSTSGKTSSLLPYSSRSGRSTFIPHSYKI